MSEQSGPSESPATWENAVVGMAKEAAGRVMGDEDLIEEGEVQEHVAQEVREEHQEERES